MALAISNADDLKRFEVLDRLILAGWASTLQRMIPADVLEAAENGWPIPTKGHDRDKALAKVKVMPTPDEVIFQRRLRDAAQKRKKYNSAHERVRQQRMKMRSRGLLVPQQQNEGNLEACQP